MKPTLSLVLIALTASFAFSAEEDLAQRVKQVLAGLDDDDFVRREAASAALIMLPAEALPLLEVEMKKTGLSEEVRKRLQKGIAPVKARAKRAEHEQKRAAAALRHRQLMLDEYEKFGSTDEKWNEPVRKVFGLAAEAWYGTKSGLVIEECQKLTKELVAAGCTDPLLIYVDARMYFITGAKKAKLVEVHNRAKTAMAASQYPAQRKFYAIIRAAEVSIGPKLNPAQKQEIEALLDEGMKYLADTAAQPEFQPTIHELCLSIINMYKTVNGDRKYGLDKVYTVLSTALPKHPAPELVMGETMTKFAWDARGGGYANTVTEEGWRLMRERLELAAAAFEKAWERDPTSPSAALGMMGVELGQSKGREVMELWFKRAMDADPDNYPACGNKLYYLEPKWHGSAEDMLEFARECIANNPTYENSLPWVIVDAYERLSAYAQEPRAFYTNAEMWQEIQPVFERFVKRNPADMRTRCKFAAFAARGEKWEIAFEQFQVIGDKPDLSVFRGGRPEFDAMRNLAAQKTGRAYSAQPAAPEK